MTSPFPDLGGIAPRVGDPHCGSKAFPTSRPCSEPATWHVAWSLTPETAGFSLVCDEHMDEVQEKYVYADRHPAEIACDMPSTGWSLAAPSRCVAVSSDDLPGGTR
ncbi:hypothetical protein CWI85_25960 [Streptomyces albidoflavus]|nr:hypothetical protein CWI85_25960 [Streptomyces albidoflavus]